MTLHFPWTGVEQLLDELKNATASKPLWGQQNPDKGLWLAGDRGVYLMANTSDGPREKVRKEGDQAFVVYAAECNPDKLPFDTWWEAKRATFGGDDGVEFIPLTDIERLVCDPPHPKATPQNLVIAFRRSRDPDAEGSFSVCMRWNLSRRDVQPKQP
jgi:Protein of unknown function (DUF3085)